MEKHTKYTIVLTLIYCALSYIGILHHEIWYDEAQAWLIARDSPSLPDLFENLKYEGHPFLWHFLLFGITRFTLDPFWMQVFHILLSTTTVFIFLKKAPFNWLFKTLFIFGYFMIFEYNLISRNYILSVLLLFLACAFYKDRKHKFLLISLLLTLTLNVHLFFAVVAISLFLLFLYEYRFENKFCSAKHFVLGIGVFLIGISSLVYQLIPPKDSLFFASKEKISLLDQATHSSSFLAKGLINIPDFRLSHFWNTNLIVNFSKPITLLLTLLLLLVPILLFYKNRKILFFVYSSFLALFLLFFLVRVHGARFNGVAWIVIVMGLWMSHQLSDANNPLQKTGAKLKWDKCRNPIIYTFLLLHFFSGIYAYSMDFKYPFCTSNQLRDYLKTNQLDTKEIVVISYEGVSLNAVLQKKVFFLSKNERQSFFNLKYDYKIDETESGVITLLRNYANTSSGDFIFVSHLNLKSINQKKVWQKINTNLKIKFLSSCGNSIFEGSDVFIYEVAKEELKTENHE